MKKLILCAVIFTAISYSCKKKESTQEPSTPTTTTGGNVQTTTTNPTITYLNRNQYFSSGGGYWAQSFSIGQSTNFVLFGAAQYAADIVLCSSSELNNFQSNLSYTKLQGWYSGAGYTTFSLPAGSYFVGIRNNNTTGTNQCCLKLDYQVSLPSSDKCSFVSYPVQDSRSLSPGQSFAIPFAYDFGYRYFVNGCNSGLSQYIMVDVDYNLFQASQPFQYVAAFSGTNIFNPGPWELNTDLLIGNTYYMVFKNNTSVTQSYSVLMSKYQKNY